MKLAEIQFTSYTDNSPDWVLEGCTLGDINLLVGKNASGKSKTLNVISNLAKTLAGDLKVLPQSANFVAVFDDAGAKVRYTLKCEQGQVVQEELNRSDTLLLERGPEGIGKIWAEKLDDYMAFQPPANELAVVARRDALQHPFLTSLYEWGKARRHFRFGTTMGKNVLARFVPREQSGDTETENLDDLDPSDTSLVVPIFAKGRRDFGQAYVRQIIEDMGRLDYELESIRLETVKGIDPEDEKNVASGLQVKEADLQFPTSQHEMSAGMFRALSLLIQVDYAALAGMPNCISIDDIGEGLDYSRSIALIKLLVEKAQQNANAQLILSTNDRFVMNGVPLEYWSVIQRLPGKARIYNYRNAKDLFDAFEFTGLSNFNFFASNYFLRQTV